MRRKSEWKKLMSVLLAGVLAAGSPVSAFASDDFFSADDFAEEVQDFGAEGFSDDAGFFEPEAEDVFTEELPQVSETASAQEKLNAIKKKFDDGGALRPEYGKYTNIIAFAQEKLKSYTDLDTEGVTVSVKTGDESEHIAADGTITYNNGPLGAWTNVINEDCTLVFKLEDAEASSDVRVTIGWDRTYFHGKMQEEADKLTWDSIKGKNTAENEVSSELTLPQCMGTSARQVWSKVTWTSDSSVITIKSTGYDGLTDPKSGVITPASEDTVVTLTATFEANDTALNSYVEKVSDFSGTEKLPAITKTFKVTVKGDGKEAATEESLKALLDKYYTADLLKEFTGGAKLDTENCTGDVQLPITSRIKDENGNSVFTNKEVKISTSDPSILEVSGYRLKANVFASDKDQVVDLILTFTRDGVTAVKRIPITVKMMLSDEALDKEIAMMEQAKAHYFDALNDGQYADKDSVTGNLHAFQEMILDEQGNPKWIYNADDKTGEGIIADSMFKDSESVEMEAAGYNKFKSSTPSVIAHENLVTTQQKGDTQVTITSVLSSEKFGKFAEQYKDNEKLRKLYKQEVSVTVTVKGTVNAADVLADKIAEAEAKLAAITEGTKGGEYPAGTKEKLTAAIEAAKAVLKNESATEKEQNDAIQSLIDTIAEIEKTKIPEQVKIDLDVNLGVGGSQFPEEITVTADKAAKYGYTKADAYKEQVTALDAMVTYFEAMIGADDYAADPMEYFTVTDAGWITKVLGENTYDCGFLVNNDQPIDPATGYGAMINQVVLQEGDHMSFFMYQDTTAYSDWYLYFTELPKSFTTGKKFTGTLKGCYAMVGAKSEKEQEDWKVALRKIGTDEDLATAVTDEDGNFTLTAPAEAGEYELYVVEDASEEDEIRTFIGNSVKINVEGNKAPALKDGKNLYSIYMNYGTKGNIIYKDLPITEYFEDDLDASDTLTYKAVDETGTEIHISTWGKPSVNVPFPGGTEKKTVTITATDSAGLVSEPVTVEMIGVQLDFTLEAKGLYKQKNSNNTYLYVYDSSKESNTIQGKVVYRVAGEEVETLPEGLNFRYEVNDRSNTVTVDENGLFTISQPSSVQNSISLIACATAENQAWNNGVYSNYYLNVYPGKVTFSDGYTVTIPEDGYLSGPISKNSNVKAYPSTSIRLESLDPEIAEVKDNGSSVNITPKKPGTAVVRATWEYDKKNYTFFEVNVLGVAVTRADGESDKILTIDPLSEEAATLQLKADGSDEKETFTWTSTDESVATVDENGLVTGLKEGSTTIYATSSLSTEENPVRGGMILQVQKAKTPYLEDLSLESYRFIGWTAENSGFRSAVLDYDFTLPTGNTLGTFNLTPVFDEEKYTAVVRCLGADGAYADHELKSGEKSTNSGAIVPGPNKVYIILTDKEDSENFTTYTFSYYRPYNTTNTITRMTMLPNGETVIPYPKYDGMAEGTMFYMNGTRKSTSWSSGNYDYTAYVFGKRTSFVTFTPTFGTSYAHGRMRVDGGEPVELVYNWATARIPLNESGTTVVTFEMMSDQAYADAQAAAKESGEEFVFTPEKTYTVTIKSVDPLGIDSQILTAEVKDAMFYAPGFKPDVYRTSILLNSGVEETEMTFTVGEGIEVYKTRAVEANLLEGEKTEEEGILKYTLPMKTGSNTVILKTWNADKSESGEASYAFTVNKRGAKDIYPDEITGYLAAGSQYTNISSYGTMPERTLVNGGGVLSLGNFGGFITYKYDTPILNSPNNPYGVDFVAYGNPFAAQASAAEPGNVMVSQDGETWYHLAGSVHFDDAADWDYTINYTNVGGKSGYSTSDGMSGTIYNYPTPSNYPYYQWDEENQQSMSFTGFRIGSDAKDPYGSSSAAYPDFGYVDVNVIERTKGGLAANPYTGHASTGDLFDLDWAVDGNGNPVHLDSISYIRISTASCIYAGAIGEKSTEVTTVARTTNVAEAPVGRTAAPQEITINGAAVSLDEQVTTVDYRGNEINVKVSAPEGTNVYINGQSGMKRTYKHALKHGMIRIITQEGEKEPDIRYIKLHQIPSASQITLSDSEKAIMEKENFKLTASLEPADAEDPLTFATSDAEVASVAEDGTVTGVKAGVAVITVTANSGITAECKVTVNCAHSGELLTIVDQLADCEHTGLAHTVCPLCNETVEKEIVLDKTAHIWGEWKVVKKATRTEKGSKERVCRKCGKKQTKSIAKIKVTVKVGDTFVSDGLIYQITSLEIGKETVKVVGTKTAKADLKTLNIEYQIRSKGIVYQITEIGEKAFKGYTSLESVRISKSLKVIGAQAFDGCKKLKKINLTSEKIKSVGKNAIRGINSKALIDVKNSQVKAAKKLFTKATGYKSTMTIK